MNVDEFKRLVLPLRRKLFGVAFRLTGNAQDAEDLVQDVYLKIWEHRDDLPLEGNLTGYSLRLTRNLFIDRLRRHHLKTVDEEPAEQDMVEEKSADEKLMAAETSSRLQRLISGLPEKQRQVTLMRDVDGMEYQEIATTLDLTEVNVRVQLSRARKTLRNLIKNTQQL